MANNTGKTQASTYTPPRDNRMSVTTVPNIVTVNNMPQGVQQTGAANNGGK